MKFTTWSLDEFVDHAHHTLRQRNTRRALAWLWLLQRAYATARWLTLAALRLGAR
jgi:hypothetical protein